MGLRNLFRRMRTPMRVSAPEPWRAMDSAPRDGTVIEIRCSWGYEPWYGNFRWSEGFFPGRFGWNRADDPRSGIIEEAEACGKLAWRPIHAGASHA